MYNSTARSRRSDSDHSHSAPRLDTEAVHARYNRSIAADNSERDAGPLWHRGQIYIIQGQFDRAEHTLRKAVAGYFSPLVLPEEEVAEAPWSGAEWAVALRFDNLRATVLVLLLG